MSFNSHCVAMLKPPESLCAKDEGVTLRKRIGQAGFEPPTNPCVHRLVRARCYCATAPPSVATSGPEPSPNFEQVFEANTESFSSLKTI